MCTIRISDSCAMDIERVESMVRMPSNLISINFVKGQSFRFGSVDFTADVAGHLASATALTEGCAFSFGALGDKTSAIYLCDMVCDQSTEPSSGKPLGSTFDFNNVTASQLVESTRSYSL
jgi:hypothetical protein